MAERGTRVGAALVLETELRDEVISIACRKPVNAPIYGVARARSDGGRLRNSSVATRKQDDNDREKLIDKWGDETNATLCMNIYGSTYKRVNQSGSKQGSI